MIKGYSVQETTKKDIYEKMRAAELHARNDLDRDKCGTMEVKPPSRLEELEGEKIHLIRRLGKLQEQIDFLRNDEYFLEKFERFDKLNRR